MPDVSIGHDGVARCSWDYPAEYRWYHDDDWGRPVVDDRRIYEKLCLEGFQSGLSWLTILRNRGTSARLRRLRHRVGRSKHFMVDATTMPNADSGRVRCSR